MMDTEGTDMRELLDGLIARVATDPGAACWRSPRCAEIST
jgi:hypothetical protein